MNRLTLEDLNRLARFYGQTETPGMPSDLRLALFILNHLIGEEWVRQNIAARPKGREPDPFGASADINESYRWEARVITFAQSVFNFQDVEGFQRWLKELRFRKDIEARLAEIQGAALMYAAGFGVRFRNATGRDLDVILPNGDVAAEIKCKVESTEPSERTIYDTLIKACGQLLDDRAGFVLLNIPESWHSNHEAMDLLTKTIKAFFEDNVVDTQRVTSVILWWEQFVPGNGGWWRVFPIQEERNPNARHPTGPVKEIAALTNSVDSPWTLLREIIVDAIPPTDASQWDC